MSDWEYACPECDGEGETVCSCCGSDLECGACEGTGLDPEKIDIGAWVAARASFPLPSWDCVRDGKTVGRETVGGAVLLYSQFLRTDVPGGIES